MSFGVGIGDVLMLSSLAYTIGKALTSGRHEAPAEFQEVQNQLFAISSALNLLSTTLDGLGGSKTTAQDGIKQDEIISQMIQNCSSTLEHLDNVLKKYPELQSDCKVDSGDSARWRQKWKDTIKKIKWTTEGTGLDNLRKKLAIHVDALNLSLAARNCIQIGNVRTQVNLTHEMLRDIHEWYLRTCKVTNDHRGSSKSNEHDILKDVTATNEENDASSRQSCGNQELKFTVSLGSSGEARLDLLCRSAAFSPALQRLHPGSRLFHCTCCEKHDLEYTLLPVSLIVCEAATRPTWKVYAFSKKCNSVVTLFICNVPPVRLHDFEQYVLHLASIQGLRSASRGVNSMLMYTSMQEDGRSSLSLLNIEGDVSNFRHELMSVTITSNGFRYTIEAIESVQLLHYITLTFPSFDGETEPDNPGPLPFRAGEVIFHTRLLGSDLEHTEMSQLLVQLNELTIVDKVGSMPGILLRGVSGKVSVLGDNDHKIEGADIELSFTSRQAADSCKSSIASLQRQIFLSYLRYPCLNEVVQFQKGIGDVMIRDMLLLDAQAVIVHSLITDEQRMIIKSACCSKSVTVIFPPASLLLSLESSRASSLAAFFVEINPEETQINKQSVEVVSVLGAIGIEHLSRTLRNR